MSAPLGRDGPEPSGPRRAASPAALPGAARAADDDVVREEPLVIEVGAEQVLTLRTPGDDADLALGFLLGEGILAGAGDVAGIELTARTDEDGAAVDVARVALRPGLALGPFQRARLSRAHAIRPSCGLCGLASPAGLTRGLPRLDPGAPRVSLDGLRALVSALRARQPLFAATGGCHAAGVFEAESGAAWAVAEDVGRHNALDKALGRAAREGRDLARAAVVLSGRAGSELVLKALRLGVPVVAAVSAPSSLAVEVALEAGQTLVAFVRPGGGRVYADDGRVVASAQRAGAAP